MSFEVPLDYCRALIVEARQQNKRARHKLPVAYAVWRPLIEAGAPSQKDAPAVVTMLEPQQFDAAMAPLVARGDELYKLPEFDPWLFDPFASLQPYIHDYLNLSAPSEHAGRKRKGTVKQTDVQKREREALVDRALDKV